jgi:2-polyprenyl-3-methyl-5-hydroxy-6-metoxy-1,4-benzoquinol methylase
MKSPTEDEILQSWNRNAPDWEQLIAQNRIESRRLITNEAIVGVLKGLPIQKMLDLGCGEGWLVRQMLRKGVRCLGIDGSQELIRMALQKKEGDFICMSYGQIIGGEAIAGSPFDTIVLNFALFDKDGTPELLKSLKSHLSDRGVIVIQSLHPDAEHAFEPSHWKKDVWAGLPGSFSHSYPWYHRSLMDWQLMFHQCGLQMKDKHEQYHPRHQRPVSIIFVLETA